MLTCKATGIPEPVITWRQIPENSGEDQSICWPQVEVAGEVVVVQNMARGCSGLYECSAQNGVLPSVRRVMRISVQFPPEVTTQVRRIIVPPTQDALLNCRIAGSPYPFVHWQRNDKVIVDSDRHLIERYDIGTDTVLLSLKIQALQEGDVGEYTCVASNYLGMAEETIFVGRQTQPALNEAANTS